MGKYKKTIFVLGALLLFFLFFVLLLVPYTPSGVILDKSQVIDRNGQAGEIKFPYLQPLGTGNRVIFQFHFSSGDGDTLVIRRPSGNALEVSLNGKRVYRLGDMENPTSNIWNSIVVVPLDYDLQGDNLLEIKLAGISYDVGLSIPPYIDDYQTVMIKEGLSRFLYHDLLYLSFGAALIAGLILIVLSLSRRPGYRGELLMGLASVLAAIFCLDYTFRVTSGSITAFFCFKKIITIAGYLSALCFLLGMERYLTHRLKIGRGMLYATLASVILVAAAWNMSVLIQIQNFFNVVLMLNIAISVILIIRNQNQKPWMIVPAVLLTLSLVQMVVLTVLRLSQPFVMQYVILATAVAFSVSMINEYNQLYRENDELEQKANRDPLTGVYNRNILTKISPRPHDVLVIMDMDNLKRYNDRFGHPEGDRLLISLAETVCSNLRQSDLVIRFGGDEFILILRDATVEMTERIMERIKTQFVHRKFISGVSFSYGIEKVGGTFSETLARADELLYSMKKTNKENLPQPDPMEPNIQA